MKMIESREQIAARQCRVGNGEPTTGRPAVVLIVDEVSAIEEPDLAREIQRKVGDMLRSTMRGL